jgi:hypothetical protein
MQFEDLLNFEQLASDTTEISWLIGDFGNILTDAWKEMDNFTGVGLMFEDLGSELGKWGEEIFESFESIDWELAYKDPTGITFLLDSIANSPLGQAIDQELNIDSSEIAHELADSPATAAEDLGAGLEELGDNIGKLGEDIADGVGEGLERLGDGIGSLGEDLADGIGGGLEDLGDAIGGGLESGYDSLQSGVDDMLNHALDTATSLGNGLLDNTMAKLKEYLPFVALIGGGCLAGYVIYSKTKSNNKDEQLRQKINEEQKKEAAKTAEFIEPFSEADVNSPDFSEFIYEAAA